MAAVHFPYAYALGTKQTPFCAGVPRSPEADANSIEQLDLCYNSNPPSSGGHLGVQRQAEVAPGVFVRIPPDPDVYPSDVVIPREAIPHILEHAGVFAGYNCPGADDTCDVSEALEDVTNERIAAGDRVVVARDPDLPEGYVGLAAWTRVDLFPMEEFTAERARNFMETLSCRFDPEGFCR